ncbi:MAG: serine hydrolase [Bryobacterales bacterium]|nr:serine hydrolase [Bryobacterales bacterium]
MLLLLLLMPWLAAAALPDLAPLAAPAQGRVGAAFSLLDTDKAYAFHGNDRFPSPGVARLPALLLLMQRLDTGRLANNQLVQITTEDFVPAPAPSALRDRYPRGTSMMLSELLDTFAPGSDATTADVLLRLLGGPEEMDGFLAFLRIPGMKLEHNERRIAGKPGLAGRNYTTPVAAIHLLHALMNPRRLKPETRQRLAGMLGAPSDGGRGISGLLPPGALVAHVRGGTETVKGVTAATNECGIVTLPGGRRLAVVILIADARAPLALREQVIARIARAAYDWAMALP